MKKTIKIWCVALVLAVFSTACSDELDTLPTSAVSTETIFETTEKAKMAINGMARIMVMQHQGYGQTFSGEGTIKFMFGEYTGNGASRPNLASGWYNVMNFNHADNNTSTYNLYPWFYYYALIGNANEFLGNIDNSEGPQAEKDFLKAQAYVYRAYCYTQLVQFYCHRWEDSKGGTTVTNLREGLVLRTVENRNEKDVPLSPSGDIYKLIYEDLDEAISLFNSSGKTRDNIWEPNVNVAYAVYARAAITKQDYPKAAAMATRARTGYELMSNDEYLDGFSDPNSEWIWGSYGGEDQTLHYYGFHSYVAYDANTSIVRTYPWVISRVIFDQIPTTDIRKDMFLDPGDDKYNKTTGKVTDGLAKKVREEHPTMLNAHQVYAYHAFKFSIKGARGVGYINQFRSAEMYLIEAEAKYYIKDEEGARKLMNALVRDSGRDASYNCTATGAELLKEIKLYRSIELWGEGFSWLDAKRYNEPMVRTSFTQGGSFHSVVKTIEPDYKNGWTYITPLYESENNDAMK